LRPGEISDCGGNLPADRWQVNMFKYLNLEKLLKNRAFPRAATLLHWLAVRPGRLSFNAAGR
jgi:hypothetical protein